MRTTQRTKGLRLTTTTIVAASLLLGACSSSEPQDGVAVDNILSEDLVTADQGDAAGTTTSSTTTAGPSATSVPGDATMAPVDGGNAGSTGGSTGSTGSTSSSGSTGSGGSTGQGSSGTSTGTTGGGSPAPTPPAGGDVAMGPGVTKDTIKLGFQSSSDLQAGFALVGASGEPIDEIAYAQAVVDDINNNGGIRGRMVEAVHHETNPAAGSFAAQAQAACATFTEDNEVFAVVSSAVGGDDSLLACLAEKGTPLVETNLWVFDRKYYEQYPNILYRPGKIVADEWVREYVLGLADLGYFEGAKVGLLRFDAPVFDRLAGGVLFPTLEKLGVARADVQEAIIGTPGSISDFGGAGAEMANAVLRFRGAGVTHVIMLENAGIMPFLFMQEAENQGFRPVYGLSSTDIPTTQAGQQEPAQLEHSVAIGWTPPNDVNHSDNPGGNPQYDRCRKVMADAGIQNLTGFYVQSRCDGGWFLKAALEAAPDLTRAGFVKGVESLGKSYLSPFAIASSFGPGKPDGADAVRPLRFDMECACYRYAGPPKFFR